MASILKIATGWRVQLPVKGQRDSRIFDTKAAASDWAIKREAEMRSISDGVGSKTHTVGDVLKEYEKRVSPTKRGARWEKLRLAIIGDIEIDGRKFSSIRLAELRSAHIANWRDARLRSVSGASVSREMSLISHALQVARKEWGWLVSDPMKEVRRPSESPPRDRLISQDEIERVLIALNYQEGVQVVLPTQRVAVAFLFAIETAMRSSEILSLTSATVDFSVRVAFLPMTKNGMARKVPLSTRAVELLRMLPPVEAGASFFNMSASSRDALFIETSVIHDITTA